MNKTSIKKMYIYIYVIQLDQVYNLLIFFYLDNTI